MSTLKYRIGAIGSGVGVALLPLVSMAQVSTSTVQSFWNSVTTTGLSFMIEVFTYTLPAILIIGFALFVVRFVARKFFGW